MLYVPDRNAPTDKKIASAKTEKHCKILQCQKNIYIVNKRKKKNSFRDLNKMLIKKNPIVIDKRWRNWTHHRHCLMLHIYLSSKKSKLVK